MTYVTLNPRNYEMRRYPSKTKALVHSIALHDKDHAHPAFMLYQSTGPTELKYIGFLRRSFGEPRLYWHII